MNPPSLTGVPYELYKQKLLAWWEVSDLRKDKQGVVIALSLPEIQEKVFRKSGLEDLKKEDGLDILKDFLDSQLMKDELSDSLEKFEEFENIQRTSRIYCYIWF